MLSSCVLERPKRKPRQTHERPYRSELLATAKYRMEQDMNESVMANETKKKFQIGAAERRASWKEERR